MINETETSWKLSALIESIVDVDVCASQQWFLDQPDVSPQSHHHGVVNHVQHHAGG